MKIKLILTFIIVLLLSSCVNKELTVSVFLYNQNDLFINELNNNLEKMFPKKYTLKVFDAQNFQIIQNEQIEKRIEAKDDLIIINPVDRTGVYSIIKKLKMENIPVIFFNREPLQVDMDIWENVYYVGCKVEQSAVIQADLISQRFGNDPEKLNEFDKNGNGVIEAIILKGEQGHQDAETRSTGVVKNLNDKGYELNILETVVANWSRAEAYEKLIPILPEFKDSLELVISNNDSMAIGAITAMRQKGFFTEDRLWTPIVGIDGLKEIHKFIDEGYLYGSVLNDSIAQSQAIIDLAQLILEGKSSDSLTYPLINEKYILINYTILQ